MRLAFPCRISLLVAVIGSLCLLSGCGGPAATGAEEGAGADHVVAMQAKTQKLGEWVTLAGSTQPLPNHAAFVSNALEGRVLEVLPAGKDGKYPHEGDWVDKGHLIVTLDNAVAKANVNSAQAAVTDAAANVEALKNSAALAKRNLEAQKDLLNRAEPGVAMSSTAIVKSYQTLYDSAQQQVAAAKAKQKGAEAAVRVAEKNLSFYDLRATIAGYLSTVKASPGQTLPVGTEVAEVINLKEIDVLCYAPPSVVNHLRLGQTAEVVRSDTQRPPGTSGPTGKVVYIAVQAQSDSGSFAVKVRFPNDKMGLRADALVQVRIETQPAKDRLVIPDEALMDDTQPPGVIVAQFEIPPPDEDQPADEKKPAAGEKEEKAWIAHQYQAVVGVRDPEHHQVEILALHSTEKDEKPPPVKDAWFVISGWHGVKPGDKLEVEFKKPATEKKEPG
jgi:RND family efflux transporter MFP subunit